MQPTHPAGPRPHASKSCHASTRVATANPVARAVCRTLLLGSLVMAAAFTARAQEAAPGTAPIPTNAPGTVPITPKATVPLLPYTGPRYDNRWEIYGGLLYMNDIAGQDLHQHYSMGGTEIMGTYWLGQANVVKHWGVAADYRFGAGTAQVDPQAEDRDLPGFNRIVVFQNAITAGGVYRLFHNRYIGVDTHLMAGEDNGDFNHALRNYPNQANLTIADCPADINATHPVSTGFYCNHWAPYGLAGGSIDFNSTNRFAIRLQPDLVVNHWGIGTREFFSISLGAIYRFGGLKTHKTEE